MTQEDKQLLLQDFCARLPYGVFVKEKNRSTPIKCDLECHPNLDDLENIKPYLRPISSMTEEEKEFFVLAVGIHLFNGTLIPSYDTLDWLNKKMFYYRGLIPKNLAVEVIEENNLYKN